MTTPASDESVSQSVGTDLSRFEKIVGGGGAIMAIVGFVAFVVGGMANSDLLTTIGGVVAAVGYLSFLPVVVRRYPWAFAKSPQMRRVLREAFEGPRPSRPKVEARIEDATRALQIAAGLVSELDAEMKARMATLERLRAENDEYEKLAALRREEAEAVSRLIGSVISSTHSKLGRSTRRDQALFFVAGLGASIPVQILVAWMT